MIPDDRRLVGGEAVEEAAAGGGGAVALVVAGELPVGVREGDDGMRQRVAEHDERA